LALENTEGGTIKKVKGVAYTLDVSPQALRSQTPSYRKCLANSSPSIFQTYAKVVDEFRFPPFLKLFGIPIHSRRNQQIHIPQKIGNEKQTGADSNWFI
jgi:hypothetical protein